MGYGPPIHTPYHPWPLSHSRRSTLLLQPIHPGPHTRVLSRPAPLRPRSLHPGELRHAPPLRLLSLRGRQPPMHRRKLRLDGRRPHHSHHRSALAHELSRHHSSHPAGKNNSPPSRPAAHAAYSTLT